MNPEKTRAALALEFARPLFLAGMALFFWRLVAQGNLLFYVNRQSSWLIVPAIPVLLLIAWSYHGRIKAFDAHACGCECECGAHDAHSSLWGLVLVAIPLLLGVIVPPAPLGAAALANRQSNLSTLASAPPAKNSQPLTREGDKNLLEWILAFQAAGDLSSFANQQAHLTGFVYHQDPMKAGDFFVSRFVVTCCVADAVPAGLLVRWPKGNAPAQDQWIDVKGHLEVVVLDGEPQPIIVADSVTPIERPSQPYLYP